ncbi:NYN domain-containing protein [Trichocoleus sp. FACHB-90]|uniref:NYN domain-containing protein n=1 Tax=Cyanophyceae TaxID=3028117 RepID=UPI001688B73F|nr:MULTISPECIES: NYN domain-containing protein [unclassified Trichocoleus]MBD1925699.1 NYN domain-containing protein [Trichocoleus sp. FACHB-90]MBD1932144.1 NYN domain-containing protein [Trichocoleus sp. FACHB-69]
MGIYNLSTPIPPIQFQKAMVFIDGTNLFYRLEAAKLSLNQNLAEIFTHFTDSRQIVRVYLYTIEQHLKKAKDFHGSHITEGIRIVYGEGIPTKDGNIKEKGVDALLVADIVYHAAVKNYDYALVVSTDTDFVKALQRIEDFGCRTGVLAVCGDLPDRLREACDEPKILTKETMLEKNWAMIRE